MRPAHLLAILSALAAIGAAPPSPVPCGMVGSLAHPDNEGRTTTAVLRDGQSGVLLFGDALHVNTDGTKRSYKVTDFWGEKDALNNLCNAMRNHCAELNDDDKRTRRIATEQAREAGWPAAALAATRINPSIIPMVTKGGRTVPCPEVDGFLVSATALTDPSIADECKLARYIDALAVSAVVIPGSSAFSGLGARIGDLAVVMRPGQSPIYAVVGDIGPSNEIGEVSIALAGKLLGKAGQPANYDEIRGRKRWVGKGWDVPNTFVLIMPGSGNATKPYIDQARIDAAAAPLFATWGGAERLLSCATSYRPR